MLKNNQSSASVYANSLIEINHIFIMILCIYIFMMLFGVCAVCHFYIYMELMFAPAVFYNLSVKLSRKLRCQMLSASPHTYIYIYRIKFNVRVFKRCFVAASLDMWQSFYGKYYKSIKIMYLKKKMAEQITSAFVINICMFKDTILIMSPHSKYCVKKRSLFLFVIFFAICICLICSILVIKFKS